MSFKFLKFPKLKVSLLWSSDGTMQDTIDHPLHDYKPDPCNSSNPLRVPSAAVEAGPAALQSSSSAASTTAAAPAEATGGSAAPPQPASGKLSSLNSRGGAGLSRGSSGRLSNRRSSSTLLQWDGEVQMLILKVGSRVDMHPLWLGKHGMALTEPFPLALATVTINVYFLASGYR